MPRYSLSIIALVFLVMPKLSGGYRKDQKPYDPLLINLKRRSKHVRTVLLILIWTWLQCHHLHQK